MREILAIAERGDSGHPEITLNATFGEMFAVVSKMVEAMALSTEGEITYNEILEDLKECDPVVTMYKEIS